MTQEAEKVIPIRAEDLAPHFEESPFASEKQFCDYIECDLLNFVTDLGYQRYISYEREARVPHGAGHNRIDFKIEIEPGYFILVECKSPKHVHRELVASIGQILDYAMCYEKHGVEIVDCWIASTKFDIGFVNLIQRFRLPVSTCILDDERIAVWKNYAGKRLK